MLLFEILYCMILIFSMHIPSINQQLEKQARPKTDALTETVIEAYRKADDYNTRTQILSLIANKYTKSELLLLIDGISVHKIDSARKHAYTHGPAHQK